MGYDIENFGFSPDILKGSGGNFKAFLKERYGFLKRDEVARLVDKFYGKDTAHGDLGGVSKKVRKTGK